MCLAEAQTLAGVPHRQELDNGACESLTRFPQFISDGPCQDRETVLCSSTRHFFEFVTWQGKTCFSSVIATQDGDNRDMLKGRKRYRRGRGVLIGKAPTATWSLIF
jgi:hypothetical protein